MKVILDTKQIIQCVTFFHSVKPLIIAPQGQCSCADRIRLDWMGYFGLVLGSLLVAVLISSLWKALLHLAWRPYSITKSFGEQGVRGPACRFWTGSLQEIRRLRKAGSGLILDNNCHDFTLRVFPHYRHWTHQYGQLLLSSVLRI